MPSIPATAAHQQGGRFSVLGAFAKDDVVEHLTITATTPGSRRCRSSCMSIVDENKW